MKHIPCQTEVFLVTRTVISQPEDVCWPKNSLVNVPYCSSCKCVVSYNEVDGEVTA